MLIGEAITLIAEAMLVFLGLVLFVYGTLGIAYMCIS